jgi:hypothetical protein
MFVTSTFPSVKLQTEMKFREQPSIKNPLHGDKLGRPPILSDLKEVHCYGIACGG